MSSVGIEIPLSRGLVALIDSEDLELVSGYRWYVVERPNGRLYAESTCGLMHRLVLTATTDEQVDHVNLDGLDNRRINLRKCTDTQQRANQRKRADSLNPYKGIKPSGRGWLARITIKGKAIHLGTFDTAELAAKAYDEAAKEAFGEFARTNF